jgi:hypothetical protein
MRLTHPSTSEIATVNRLRRKKVQVTARPTFPEGSRSQAEGLVHPPQAEGLFTTSGRRPVRFPGRSPSTFPARATGAASTPLTLHNLARPVGPRPPRYLLQSVCVAPETKKLRGAIRTLKLDMSA